MSTPATKPAFESDQGPRRKVFVTKPYDLEGKGRVLVIPATVHLDPEELPETIEFINQTGGPVTIWLPNGNHFLKPYKDPGTDKVHEFIQPIDVATTGELLVEVKEQVPNGYYEYNVYCNVIEDYAQGHSSPVVCCP
jgi:hypothetical protein